MGFAHGLRHPAFATHFTHPWVSHAPHYDIRVAVGLPPPWVRSIVRLAHYDSFLSSRAVFLLWYSARNRD